MSGCPSVACTRRILAPLSMAWEAWACLSLTILSACRAVIARGWPPLPFFWERNKGVSSSGRASKESSSKRERGTSTGRVFAPLPATGAGYRCGLPVRATGTLELGLERETEIGTGEEVRIGAFERVRDQLLRSLGVRDSSVELRDLALG